MKREVSGGSRRIMEWIGRTLARACPAGRCVPLIAWLGRRAAKPSRCGCDRRAAIILTAYMARQ